jgi:hypothetical protein
MTAMLKRTHFLHCLIVGCLAVGCGIDPTGGPVGTAGGGGTGAGTGTLPCGYGQTVCDGNVARVCDGRGSFMSTTQCSGADKCRDGLGCVSCVPNTSTCTNKTLKVCDSAGNPTYFACDGRGTSCEMDGCKGPCSPTSLGLSNKGCDFWPTVTANPVWSGVPAALGNGGFHFGVLIGNVSPVQTTVTVTAGGAPARSSSLDSNGQLTLAPNGIAVVPLEWVSDLKGPDWSKPFLPITLTESISKQGAAYHVVSDQPIIAYQFSPIEVILGDNQNCPVVENGGGCYSYSTDASALLPSHVLTPGYVATGYRGWRTPAAAAGGALNGGDFLAITAVQANSSVKITPPAGQAILALADGTRAPTGQPISMGAGDVLELFNPGMSDDSFSGTVVEEVNGRPLQVLSGASCGTVPAGLGNCGHMEDPVFPNGTLGTEYVVPALPRAASSGYTLRIHALSDGTALSFEPSSMYRNVTLSRGDVLEIQGTADARILGTTPFAVTQFLNGGVSSRDEGGPGQLAVTPRSQYQQEYKFLAAPDQSLVPGDSNSLSSFVIIMAPTGARVKLDGRSLAVDMFNAVGASGISVLSLPLNQNNQVHTLSADRPVGIVVYGYGKTLYTNYLYSGGQQFNRTGSAIQ